MAKERIAKWSYNEITTVLALIDAKTGTQVAFATLSEIPGFVGLPEYAKFHLQYGVRQDCADPNAGTKGTPKLEGMKLNLQAWKEKTFARAKVERLPSVGILRMIELAKTKADMAFVKTAIEAEGKEIPKAFEAKMKTFPNEKKSQ